MMVAGHRRRISKTCGVVDIWVFYGDFRIQGFRPGKTSALLDLSEDVYLYVGEDVCSINPFLRFV